MEKLRGLLAIERSQRQVVDLPPPLPTLRAKPN
jgi:hypothetical protein